MVMWVLSLWKLRQTKKGMTDCLEKKLTTLILLYGRSLT